MSSPIPVTRPTLPPFEEYTSLIKSIWENRWLTNAGPLHQQLEENLKQYLRAPYLSLYTNGHNALEAAIHACNLPKGSEVITTPYTFASTTHAIVRCGLKPVFCDISYEDYNIDVTKIEELITENTSAVLPVHVYGTPCDVEGIGRIAKKYDLKVIYDAAHAFGVELNGQPITSFGDVSMLSFHATKVFNTVEGGAVVSADKSIIEKANRYKNFGMEGQQDDFLEPGTNAKMSEFHAAMGLLNLRHINESLKKRHIISDVYTQLLSDVSGIKLLKHSNNISWNYAYYPVVFEESSEIHRNEICQLLGGYNIFPRKYFYPIIPKMSCYDYINADVPVALNVSERVLCLPLYDSLTIDCVEKISGIILSGK